MRKYTIKDKEGEEHLVEHVVNLQAENQSIQLVRSCCISIPRRKCLFTKLPSETYTISVECDIPDVWIVKPNDSVMKIGYGGQVSKEMSIVVNSNQVDFQLFFDPNQILDCTTKESSVNQSYNISYNILLKDSITGDVMTEQSGIITARLDPISVSAPLISFSSNEIGANLVYNVNYDRPVEIGSLVIRHACNLLRAPSCNIVLNVLAKVRDNEGHLKQIDDLITFGDVVRQSNPRYIESGIKPNGSDGSDFTFKIIGGRTAELKNVDVNKNNNVGHNDNVITIPIFWNMSLLSNPENKTVEYIIFVEAKYTTLSSDSLLSSTAFYDNMKVVLKKNMTMMDIEVLLKEGKLTEVIKNNTSVTQRVPDMVSGAFSSYSIILRNTAEISERGKEDARIYVKEFSCLLPQKGKFVKEKHGAVKETLFSESDNSTIQQGANASIPIKGSIAYTFCYDHTCIEDIISDTGEKKYERVVKIPLGFKYYVDKENTYNSLEEIPVDEFQSFKAAIPIKVRKAPNPEWLCLDFGTSAVVATYASHHYDSHGRRIDCLVPLRETKQNLLREQYRADRDNLRNILNDTTETDKNLIASDIVVDTHKTSVGDADLNKSLGNISNYKEAPMKFSPSSGLLDINIRKIPSLKSLMGNRSIPADLMPHMVSVNGELTVNKIFETAYRQLFKLFLPQEVHHTNKLVMTIPNTYAPSHIEILRQIALDSLKNLRPDYIRFMSESDAVAFYYLSRRADLMEGTELDDDFDKNVLVYDMGAGTLDITYFTRHERGDKYEIEMLGKMGVSRAGNYMDYILADVVVDLLKAKIQDSAVSEKLFDLLKLENYKNRDADAASELKHFVRDLVKPRLNSSEDTILPALKLFGREMPTVEITIGEILRHDRFKTYLNDASVEIFKHFKALFDREDSRISPNLVIFSGRTTCLRVLREAVKNALSELSDNAASCYFLDLAGENFSKDIAAEITNISNLKTAVVDGAFSFCTDFAAGQGEYILKNKNVYAQYGLMFKIGNTWHWEKLIDTNTIPTNLDEAVLSDDGMTIYEYDSDINDASGVSEIGSFNSRINRRRDFTSVSMVYVLQSYSADTLDDWKKQNHDMISVIGYADLVNVVGIKDYSITIDNKNQVNLHVGSNQMPLYSHDEYDSKSFRMSMWPIVR